MLHLIGGNIVVVLQSFLVAFHSDWIVFPENEALKILWTKLNVHRFPPGTPCFWVLRSGYSGEPLTFSGSTVMLLGLFCDIFGTPVYSYPGLM